MINASFHFCDAILEYVTAHQTRCCCVKTHSFKTYNFVNIVRYTQGRRLRRHDEEEMSRRTATSAVCMYVCACVCVCVRVSVCVVCV